MAKEKSILKSVGKGMSITLKEKHSPKKFFKTGDGLYVWSSFDTNILKKAKETKAGAKFKLASHDLIERSTDEQIEHALPPRHIFSETDVCAVIADLISQQPKGKKGALINNGYANLFYTPSHVVGVHWCDGGWGVVVWGRDGVGWSGGGRVFSPATEI